VNAVKLFLLAEITTVDVILPFRLPQLVRQEVAVLRSAVNKLLDVKTLTVVVSPENVAIRSAPEQDALLLPVVKLLCTAVHTPASLVPF
jgi:hypothetical protein